MLHRSNIIEELLILLMFILQRQRGRQPAKYIILGMKSYADQILGLASPYQV